LLLTSPREADEALREGILAVLEQFLTPPRLMSRDLSALMLESALRPDACSTLMYETMKLTILAGMSSAVLMELCRYRRGW
jgi:hypothetical protein